MTTGGRSNIRKSEERDGRNQFYKVHLGLLCIGKTRQCIRGSRSLQSPASASSFFALLSRSCFFTSDSLRSDMSLGSLRNSAHR